MSRGFWAIRKTHLKKLRDSFHRGDFRNSRFLLEEIEIIDRYIVAHNLALKRKIVKTLSIIIPLISILLALFIVHLSWPENKISGALYCGECKIEIPRGWSNRSELNLVGKFNIFGSDKSEFWILKNADSLYKRLYNENNIQIEIDTDSTIIDADKIHIGRQGKLCTKVLPGKHSMFQIWGIGAQVKFRLKGEIKLKIYDQNKVTILDTSLNLNKYETIVCHNHDLNSPLRISFIPKNLWLFDFDNVNSISFDYEFPHADSYHSDKSSIDSGHIELPDVETQYSLRSGDYIELVDYHANVNLFLSSNFHRVDFNGKVKKAYIRYHADKDRISPSIYRYIINNWDMEFWIGVLSFIGVVLWGSRKLIRP